MLHSPLQVCPLHGTSWDVSSYSSVTVNFWVSPRLSLGCVKFFLRISAFSPFIEWQERSRRRHSCLLLSQQGIYPDHRAHWFVPSSSHGLGYLFHQLIKFSLCALMLAHRCPGSTHCPRRSWVYCWSWVVMFLQEEDWARWMTRGIRLPYKRVVTMCNWGFRRRISREILVTSFPNTPPPPIFLPLLATIYRLLICALGLDLWDSLGAPSIGIFPL